MFVGNPGTGKTTVAKLYGEILKHLGLLSKGDVIIKNPSDFVGNVLGSSESLTRSILAQAEGCILVIDEAYSLNPSPGSGSTGANDPYKSAVLDTIVEQVQGRPGEDRVVIMLGYRKQMEAMFQAANPGLARRFQLSDAFEFKDYDNQSLLKILKQDAREANFNLDMTVGRFAIQQLEKARALPNFGNAGAVKTLFSNAKIRAMSRNSKTLIEADFCEGGKIPQSGDEENIFADLVGCSHIIDKLQEIRATIEFAKKNNDDPKSNINYHYIFSGSPGTGKTTIARRIGKLYRSFGLLPFDEVMETSASDFMTGYAGQSGIRTRDLIRKARGKVLFIDEAYQLNPERGGQYAQEALDELVKEITLAENCRNIVIILAGYENEMDALMRVNSGLRSRFTRISFTDFDTPSIINLLQKSLQKKKLILSDEFTDMLIPLVDKLRSTPNFGNGRDVATLVENIYRSCAKNQSNIVTPLILQQSFDSMIATQKDASVSSAMNTFKENEEKLKTATMSSFSSSYVPHASTVVTTSMRSDSVNDSMRPEPESKSDVSHSSNFQSIFTQTLQDVLDQMRLNTKDGVSYLSKLSLDSAHLNDIAQQIASRTNLALDEVLEFLQKWQVESRSIEDLANNFENEIEKAKKLKTKTRVPIWRCGVCGRADQPYIACYVAPYIVRYEERDFGN